MSDTETISPAEAMVQRLYDDGDDLRTRVSAAAMLRALDAECDRLRTALHRIATTGTDQAPAEGNNPAHYQHIAWDLIGTATRALATDARQVPRG